jgi:hypothetical protein
VGRRSRIDPAALTEVVRRCLEAGAPVIATVADEFGLEADTQVYQALARARRAGWPIPKLRTGPQAGSGGTIGRPSQPMVLRCADCRFVYPPHSALELAIHVRREHHRTITAAERTPTPHHERARRQK